MAVSSLVNLLETLRSVLGGENSAEAKGDNVHRLIEDIAHVTLRELLAGDIEFCVGLFSEESTGLVSLLRSLIGKKEHQNAISESLKFFKAFVEKLQTLSTPFAKVLKDLCWIVYVKDSSVKTRSAVLPLLMVVCTRSRTKQAAEELDIKLLAQRFYDDLHDKNIKPTVKQHLFTFLGFLCENFPLVMIQHAENLASRYLSTLKHQMKSSTSPEIPVIVGCLRGLYYFLEKFDRSAQPDQAQEILSAIMSATHVDLQQKLNSYDVVKAALELIDRHTNQFKAFLLDRRFLELYEQLSYWSKHANREVRLVGMTALESYMKTIATVLAEDEADASLRNETFRKYVRTFASTMKNPQASSSDVARAIRGFGYLAKPCRKFLAAGEVEVMLDEMLDRSYQLLASEDESENGTRSFPSFLDSIACILGQLDQITDAAAERTERLVVYSFVNFPKLLPKSRDLCLKGIAHILLELSTKNVAFSHWLTRTVFCCVLHMCSYPPITAASDMKGAAVVEEAFKPTSYADFVPVWKYMLGLSPTVIQGYPVAVITYVKVLVYDELLKSILNILEKLNLSAVKSLSAGSESINLASTNVDDLHPVTPKDYQVMMNVVCIFTEIFSKHCVEYFNRWTFTFCYSIINMSTKYPLVSGFYRILATCMKCCMENRFFAAQALVGGSMDVDSGAAEKTDRAHVLSLFAKFAKEVLVRTRLYKDELLAASIDFVLSLPVEVVIVELSDLTAALKIAFKLGLGYLPLATRGLAALKTWCASLPTQEIEPCIREVLPYLDPYLGLADITGTKKDGVFTTSIHAGRRTRSLPKQLLRLAKDGFKDDSSELARLKTDILHLLASLGGDVRRYLVEGAADPSDVVNWDEVRHLRFDLPFVDFKASIHLDGFLPLVAELATVAPERQTKVAACELLHALVVYMLGRSAQRTEAIQQRLPLTKLYSKLLPVLLELATDVDTVAKQLFEPLVFQIIHWFTGNRQYEHTDTATLLDAIMDGIVDPHRTALRDFSAKCLREFLVWSIKQTSKKQQEERPHNVKSLLKRMYSLARHPGSNVRLGAALTFNSIYVVFREEESLVNAFTLEILDNFIQSLALAHCDERSLGTQEEACKAIEHLERILREKNALFNKPSKLRRLPRIEGVKHGTLTEVVRWLLRQCGCMQTECRHMSMRLVWTLSSCLPGVRSCSEYFASLLATEGAASIIRNFEAQAFADGREGIAFTPTLQSRAFQDAGSSLLRTAMLWLDMLLAALDCYHWVLDAGLLTAAHLLQGRQAEDSRVFEAISYFVKRVGLKELPELAVDLGCQSDIAFTPKEIGTYNRCKCTVIVKLLDLLSILIKTGVEVVPHALLVEPLHWDLIGRCVLAPTSIGFDMADIEVMEKLPELLSLVLSCYSTLPENVLQEGYKALHTLLSQSTYDFRSLLPLDLLQADAHSITYVHLVNGYNLLHGAGFLSKCLGWPQRPWAQEQLSNLAAALVSSAVEIACRNEGVGQGSTYPLGQKPQNYVALGSAMLNLAVSLGLPIMSLVTIITDRRQLSGLSSEAHSDLGVQLSRGAQVYRTYGQCINECLLQLVAEALLLLLADNTPLALDVIQGMLEHTRANRKARKRYGTNVVTALIQNWPAVSCLSSLHTSNAVVQARSLKAVSLSMLKKILLIDSDIFRYSGSEEVLSSYINLLTDTGSDCSMALKCEALDLLMIFASCSGPCQERLRIALDQFVMDSFPLHSKEYPPGSPQYDDYVSALTKILVAMEVTRSLFILDLLIKLFCRELQHSMAKHVHTYLERFTQRLKPDDQKLALDVPFQVFVDEKVFPSIVVRQAALVNVCLVMMLHVQGSALVDFFAAHIVEIMGILSSKTVRAPEAAFENQVMQRTCCFRLIEVMYSRMNKDDVFSQSSKISAKWKADVLKPDSYKEMTKDITGWARDCKNEDMRGETVLLEQRRQLHCAAYNALIAIIMCTQTDIKFYNTFLFNDEPAKGHLQLDNIMDKTKSYSFDVLLTELPHRRRQLVALRNASDHHVSEAKDPTASHLQYLGSQYLADSSLAEDLGRYDFSTSKLREVPDIGEGRVNESADVMESPYLGMNADEAAQQVSASSTVASNGFVELEADDLNSHECMATLTAVLRHMSLNKITPVITKADKLEDMPRWMAYIYGKLDIPAVDLNVKLFLVKLVINNEQVFRPYATLLLAPLVKFLATGRNGGEGLHTLAVDLIVTMLSWSSDRVPANTAEGRSLAVQLIEFIVRNVYHPRRDVLRTNVELLKAVVEQWKDVANIPSRAVHDLLLQQNAGSKGPVDKLRYVAGIEVVAIFLANSMTPYQGVDSSQCERFYGDLARLMLHDAKAVYEPAAEVVGMVMKLLSSADKALLERYQQFVSKGLEQFPKIEKLIECLHKLQLHYSLICDRYMNKILFVLPKIYGVFRLMALEVVLSRVQVLDSAFEALQAKDFLSMLSHRDDSIQMTALRIVKALLPRLQPMQLWTWLPAVSECAGRAMPAQCRRQSCEIFMWTYDNYRNEKNEVGTKIRQLTKQALLQCLCDEDAAIRLVIQNFWTLGDRLPSTTPERMLAMLQLLYLPQTETEYLSCATNILLEMTSRSPDFNKELFEHPLSDCKFQEYSVQASWQHRHSTMAPLFADTLAASTQLSSAWAGEVQREAEAPASTIELRATVDAAQFAATQLGPGVAYDWVTQSTVDTFLDGDWNKQSGGTFSSLMLAVGPSSAKGASLRKPGSEFGQHRLPTPVPLKDIVDGNSGQQDLRHLRRRFLKDRDSSKAYFAKRQLAISLRKTELTRLQTAQRESTVIMYRKYRAGDLPDIQIKSSAIISPLQALATRDSAVAQLLLSSIFRAIYSHMKLEQSEAAFSDFVTRVSSALASMLDRSTQSFSPFVAFVLEVSSYPTADQALAGRAGLNLDVALAGVASQRSAQQALGIVYLEEALLRESRLSVSAASSGPPQAKRARKNAAAVSTAAAIPAQARMETWLELVKLHKQIKNYEVVTGIFSGEMSTTPYTKEALEFEIMSKYRQAVQKYEEALTCKDWKGHEPSAAEQDFWDEARFQCLGQLTEWKEMEKKLLDNLGGSWNRVWDPQNRTYLPYAVRAKTKLLLAGDDAQADLMKFVNESCQTIERRALLEADYSDTLAILYASQHDWGAASHFATMTLERFLMDWASQSTLLQQSRAVHLQSLQELMEMKTFLNFITEDSMCRETVETTITHWMRTLPSVHADAAGTWDDIFVNRCVYLDMFGQKFGDEDAYVQQQINMKLWQAQIAIKQSNLGLAKKLLSRTLKAVSDVGGSMQKASWKNCYGHMRLAQVAAGGCNTEKVVELMTKTYSQLCYCMMDMELAQSSPSLVLDGSIIICKTFEETALALLANGNSLPMLVADAARKLGCLTGGSEVPLPDNCIAAIINKGYECADQLCANARKMSEAAANKSLALMTLVTYCDKFLRMKEQGDSRAAKAMGMASAEKFAVASTRALLQSMRLGSSEARQWFPRLLQLLESYPGPCSEAFAAEVDSVPCWMFLKWVGQMLAILDRPEAKVTWPILQSIANEYPQALVYPFNLSKEKYQSGRLAGAAGPGCLDIIQRLNDQLGKLHLVKKFISSLECFAQPEAIFENWIIETKEYFDDKLMFKDTVSRCYAKMYHQLLQASPAVAAGEHHLDSYFAKESSLPSLGAYFRNFSDVWKKKIDDTFGVKGEKLLKMDKATFCDAGRQLLKGMKDMRNLAPPGLLKDYSLWLSEFSAHKFAEVLELPGQYYGDTKPLPEYHVKIAGFDEKVLVMQSLRKPKRITVRGNNEKDYSLLVKCGEDLRQDQRIQQLFDIMNHVLRQSSRGGRAVAGLRTYRVVPMSSRLGIIEWMENVKTLKEFQLSAMDDEERTRAGESRKKYTERYTEPAMYLSTVTKYGPVEVEQLLATCEQFYPEDVLRRAVLRMSRSAEAFLALKTNGIVSHALLSCCHYLLGIGDRHLSNFMVDTISGSLVGIDFGHAFGSATTLLPVPELMPFRLTRQLLNFMLPYGVDGLFTQTMIAAMRALRQNSDLLLNTMDVFVKEPSLDWKENAKKQLNSMAQVSGQLRAAGQSALAASSAQQTSDDDMWYPQEKIAFARRKLRGDHPSAIMADEVRLNRTVSANKDTRLPLRLGHVIHGSEAQRLRSRLPDSGLTVKEQVEALIDQAVDPNILGRTWVGWEPYF